MAEEKKEESAAPVKKKLDLQTILIVVNLIAVLGTAGTIAYTKILYKKSKITDEAATKHIADATKNTSNEAANGKPAERPLVTMDEMRVNLAPKNGENHFAVFSMSVECLDEAAAARFKERKDILVDKLINIMNHKYLEELDNVQSRTIFKEEIIRSFNEVLGARSVIDIYFSNIALQ